MQVGAGEGKLLLSETFSLVFFFTRAIPRGARAPKNTKKITAKTPPKTPKNTQKHLQNTPQNTHKQSYNVMHSLTKSYKVIQSQTKLSVLCQSVNLSLCDLRSL